MIRPNQREKYAQKVQTCKLMEGVVYSTVTDDFIISTIADYKGEVILIERKIETIRKSFAEEESLIYAASIPGINGREDTPASPFERDLQTVYERYQKLKKIRTEDGIGYITELFEKKDSMDRVMASFRAIPENRRSVLENLYIKHRGMKRMQAIYETAKELFVTERQVMRLRRKALCDIRDLYESGKSLFELQMLPHDADCGAGLLEVRLA